MTRVAIEEGRRESDIITKITDGMEIIVAATLDKSIDTLTTENVLMDRSFPDEFLLIYRYFITSRELFAKLEAK